jgi:hypothetical protein
VVARGQDSVLESRVPGGAQPLLGLVLLWIELRRVFQYSRGVVVDLNPCVSMIFWISSGVRRRCPNSRPAIMGHEMPYWPCTADRPQ